ncbi:Predicted arabinose efflux permease, MFS family [Microbulbifer donghaiensis]|uniref:Predicted arabinose efflux permease, MFS family n=1 Tax=Microbulbifer donghaiensis TaxID=494016 RepID=A0A1M4X7R2_9GAMM|nr:MFS transporter [Microbulbifer donghaiensis]SHE89526.1 Predicted arabinose efflux permease, MFS family [Microbulbifer donghaiensis]
MHLFHNWRRAEIMLLLLATAMPLSFGVWQALLNNFVIERAGFSGADIGLLQSVREIPGFLAFTVIFVLLLVREQRLAFLALIATGLGVALTGWFPTTAGLLLTTLIMSTGFHYYESLQSSLALQWLPKETSAIWFGRMLAAGSLASLAAYGLVWLTSDQWELDYRWIYMLGGGMTIVIVALIWLLFPSFPQPHSQHKKLILRRRYWLYYALTFMSGARRQIFVVFAGFLMVEKFGYSVADIALLFILNHLLNLYVAPRVGKFIVRFGERSALTIEYIGLALVFGGYALAESATAAALLYIVDHLFFSMAIAIKSYFQKIVDERDIAASAAVSFTINHIAAVAIPVLFGLLWLVSPAAVFWCGAAMALVSLLLAQNIPGQPARGNEVRIGRGFAAGQKLAGPA